LKIGHGNIQDDEVIGRGADLFTSQQWHNTQEVEGAETEPCNQVAATDNLRLAGQAQEIW